MGIGCPDCRVVSGDHDDDCQHHPAARRAKYFADIEADERADCLLEELRVASQWAVRWKAKAWQQQRRIDALFAIIEHGDEEHRKWLKQKLKEHFE